MNIREMLMGDVLLKREITALTGYNIYRYSIFLLLSAIAIYSFTVPLANAAKPEPPPIECSISQNSASAMVGVPVTLTAEVNRNGRKGYAWSFHGDEVAPSTSTENPVSVTYSATGIYAVDLELSVKGETITCHSSVEVSGEDGSTPPTSPPVELPDVSINSTSQNGMPGMPVIEQLFAGQSGYQIFSANDLGMHCGDFDTRISSILPPFQVVHTQVIRRGSEPDILTPDDGVEVVYSAASNPDDPILSGINSAGTAILATGGTIIEADYPVLSSLTADGTGTVFKTNFWDIVSGGTEPTALSAYRPFYPPGILDYFYPNGGKDVNGDVNILDLGLPMPNVERLYLGDRVLTAEQQSMPGRFGPYMQNVPQTFTLFTIDQPFFTTFPFGYTSRDVNWFETAGVPMTAFDDFGRENPWPLYRFQALSGGVVLASTDVVLPISGEANCGFCHNAIGDGGNGAATAALGENVATADEDTDNVPMEVSLEWAADINLIRLHDQKHHTNLENNTPVVCQSCHYTPALDLAQVGPKGPADADGNGRQQTNVRSMSNVMHSNHATVTGIDGELLFPVMPPPVDESGNLRDELLASNILQKTCYQCHPGRRTDCLRGAMANGGMLCQDCHGDMEQVGNDFSKFVTPDNPGDFRLASDFYTNPDTLRVPWANEPGCGSCHTGDAIDNMHGVPGTIGDPEDGIRLMQAYLTTDDKAKPIVPTNKRFAENTVENSDPGAGNPMLYRVSKGHEDVFCEACHGATHGIWPNKNPNANDNVTAMQLQGHTGTITECTTCHTGGFNIEDFKNSVTSGNGYMAGPHGMHPVNNSMWNDKHKEVFELNKDSCRTCHGVDGEGTVLSTTAATRTMECKNTDGNFPECAAGEEFATVERNTPIACDNCHAMEN